MRTYFQDFQKDDGSPITVEYSVAGSYVAPSYSPHSGADGGDAPEIGIIDAWPNTEDYNALIRKRDAILYNPPPYKPRDPAFIYGDERLEFDEVDDAIERLEASAKLTDVECERMEQWLYEHHVEEPDEPDF